MRRIYFCLSLSAVFFVFCLSIHAQQTGKIFRIGFLDNSSASGNAPLLEAFRQEMRTLGWIEGKNFTFEYRYAEGKFDRLPDLAADLVRLKVDLIVVSGGNRRWRPRAPLRLSPL
jgi:putative tryptophan/tyrosine transport system substrate-binding protein